nr:DNA repair ATPase [Alkalilimnicola ehrlichii]
MTDAEQQQDENTLEEGGTYTVIRRRLEQQAQAVAAKAERLNNSREETFGSTDMAVIGGARVRTENNCVARDIACVGEYLLFGYQVHLGLKQQTRIEDVFGLHRLHVDADGSELESVPVAGTFLDDPSFRRDFDDLFKYYKESRLIQLRVLTGKLLAIFQTGSTFEDQKVFRWSIHPDGRAEYIDDRGDRDNTVPPRYDFEWVETTREHHVHGRHPHVNILDEVFVETLNGTLTIKVENNTEDGEGIYSEAVEDRNQSLQDADIHYAKVGTLILLRILPYRETQERHFVFNTRTRDVRRIDELSGACRQLPEDHGIIFPGGFYLQNAQYRLFDADVADMRFLREVRSPNGEDVLYVFYHRLDGRFVLLSYNVIRQDVATPIYCHGHATQSDGTMVLFRTEDKPGRVHSLQLWHTPYCDEEHARRSRKIRRSWPASVTPNSCARFPIFTPSSDRFGGRNRPGRAMKISSRRFSVPAICTTGSAARKSTTSIRNCGACRRLPSKFWMNSIATTRYVSAPVMHCRTPSGSRVRCSAVSAAPSGAKFSVMSTRCNSCVVSAAG